MPAGAQNNLLKKLRQSILTVPAFFAFFLTALSCLAPDAPAVEKVCPHYPACSEASALRANPVGGHEEEAVLRIDPLTSGQFLLRSDCRCEWPGGRSGSCATLPEQSATDILPDNNWGKSYFFSEIRLVYYRNLWQRVLPCRAGPVAA